MSGEDSSLAAGSRLHLRRGVRCWRRLLWFPCWGGLVSWERRFTDSVPRPSQLSVAADLEVRGSASTVGPAAPSVLPSPIGAHI